MIICFFGHADFHQSNEIKEPLLNFIRIIAAQEQTTFLLGEQGNFDSFAYNCCCYCKKNHPRTQIEFIIPYREFAERLKSHVLVDRIVYPDLDYIPKRFAILRRNAWMIEQSDLVITYVNYHRGGAYQALQLALKKGKKVKNFGQLKI